MKKLAVLVAVLASLMVAPVADAHAGYSYNTGWPCQYFGQWVPLSATDGYFCYTTYTWFFVHRHI